SDWALAVTSIAIVERNAPAMNVLRSKQTGRHRTATVAHSIIRRPPFSNRYSSGDRSLLAGHSTLWALFHEVLGRQACCIERSSHGSPSAPCRFLRSDSSTNSGHIASHAPLAA